MAAAGLAGTGVTRSATRAWIDELVGFSRLLIIIKLRYILILSLHIKFIAEMQ